VTASTLQDAGVLVGAVAALILAMAVAVAIVRRQFTRLDAKVGDLHVTAEAVNKAVNNVPHGAKSLLDKIDDLHSKQDSFIAETEEWRQTVDDRLTRIEDHITRPPATRKRAS
jgi:uncharacterized protein YoxC